MPATSPDPDADLLARLRDGDTTASNDLARAYMDGLVEHLRRKHPTAHEHALFTAAEDALISLYKNPDGFDPAKGSLGAYLRMAAVGDLRNARKKEDRHHRRRVGADAVELAADPRNDSAGDADGPSFDDPRLAAVIAGFTEDERRFFDRLRAGEKRTAELAVVLGLAGRPAAEQQAAVKKARDRLLKRLQRATEAT